MPVCPGAYSVSHPSAFAASRNARQALTSAPFDTANWPRVCLAICQCGLFCRPKFMCIINACASDSSLIRVAPDSGLSLRGSKPCEVLKS
jgi:hypothetical protein